MRAPSFVLLEDRGVLAVGGEDAREFLQGLVSNDMRRLATDRALYAAMLTPQGRYLHDFFVIAIRDDAGNEELLIDCEGERLADLRRRLGMYRLRSKVVLEERGGALAVAALIGEGVAAALGVGEEPGRAVPFAGGVAYIDPRLAEAGARAIMPRGKAAESLAAAGFAPAERTAYERLRIGLGLPDGSRDLEVERALLLENGFDELGGIDWDKGCYMGQEVTARTRYRGLIKRRLVPVTVEGPLPACGTPVLREGKAVGEIRSGADGMALALLRVEALGAATAGSQPLRAGDAVLIVHKPGWMRAPRPGEDGAGLNSG